MARASGCKAPVHVIEPFTAVEATAPPPRSTVATPETVLGRLGRIKHVPSRAALSPKAVVIPALRHVGDAPEADIVVRMATSMLWIRSVRSADRQEGRCYPGDIKR